jgi:quercetin dioxygenase-like cupin family protein
MTCKRILTMVSIMLAAVLLQLETVSAQIVEPDEHGFMIATPDQLKPADGSIITLLFGDPSKAGIYVIQITWPPGRGSRPHFHNSARYINVLKGTWYVHTGPESDNYNPDAMTAVGPGTFIYEPPYGHHYDLAKDEEVIVQIFGMGPVTTTSLSQQ